MELQYRGCDISYQINGDKDLFSSQGWITVHVKDEVMIEIPPQTHATYKEAKEDVIKRAKIWIDERIDNGDLRRL